MMELVTKMAQEVAKIYGYKHLSVQSVKEIDCTELLDNTIGLSFVEPLYVVSFYSNHADWVANSESDATAFVVSNGYVKNSVVGYYDARTFMFFGRNCWGNGTGNFTLLDVLPVKVGV